MRAISLWQPWASLWLSERKIHETRHWLTNYRGPLLVHAAKKIIYDLEPNLREIVEDEFGGHWPMDLPRGAIIGQVELVDCVPTESLPPLPAPDMRDDRFCGDFTPRRFAWRRAAFRVFDRPTPYKGRQQFFDVPDSVLPSPTFPYRPLSGAR